MQLSNKCTFFFNEQNVSFPLFILKILLKNQIISSKKSLNMGIMMFLRDFKPTRWLLIPAKFRYIDREFSSKKINFLDIGAGNHSASKTKDWFPDFEYHGVDLDKNYNNDQHDFELMSKFYELNLEHLQFDEIPNNYFDFIMLAHIIEHLKNGDLVIENLMPKLKKGGCIYIEYPGQKSTTLPSMQGTLNFYDDPTHVRVYSTTELENVLKKHDMKIISSGYRRHMPTMLMMPVKFIYNLLYKRQLVASIFWDYFGFAEYVYAKK
jgi:2-polyprenyl-3-methyl-5-hydroxy-6-metoxy-1,4-benzoquinol methylase